MTKKLWIFGDSYSAIDPRFQNHDKTWPSRISQSFYVENFSVPGTSFLYSLDILCKNLNQDTSDIDLIFFVSSMDRPNFSFLHIPSDASAMKFVANNTAINSWSKNKIEKYKKYKKFIQDFFRYYQTYNQHTNKIQHISLLLYLKEISKKFKSVLVVPIFDDLTNEILQVDKHFQISKGYPLRQHDSQNKHFDLPNHMDEYNHDILYTLLEDWITNKNLPDTKKIIKIS